MDKNGYGILKLTRHRSSGGDLDALLKSSSHTIMFRNVVHTLLCIAALILGFSISREAVLIVVSFRLPHGSLFVKTTTSVHGHEVAIISFPRMKHSRGTFSGSEIRIVHPKELSRPVLDGNPHGQEENLAITKSKIELHHTTAHVPSIHEPPAAMAPSTTQSNSSRVPIGRHEILIRAWPHPDPLQTVTAHHLMHRVQEEQRPNLGLTDRKQLLVVTSTYVDEFQSARLTCLSHTLRLIQGPLIWIVVEAGKRSNGTDAVLVGSTLDFRHVSLNMGTSQSENLEACLQTEGLRFIREHHLEGVVVFVDGTSTYNLNFFDEVQRVNWLGSFPIRAPPCSDTEGLAHSNMQNRTDQSSINQEGPCNLSVCDAYWYPLLTNGSNQGNRSMENSHWSNFALNARVLWESPAVSWIKSWDEVALRNQTSLQSPLNLVSNKTYIETLGKCGCFKPGASLEQV